jgi:ubiquinone/menaquinone biosynthesis C-methylase UbiE
MSAPVRHPLFARLQTWMTSREPESAIERRRELLSGLSGRVLEVGAGGGANFAHYPSAVSEVLAVEPEPYMRERARVAAVRSPVPVTVLDGTAERLPAADESCDAAVACLVLCSVRDQPPALAELRRVLRPAGELRFYEHVLSNRLSLATAQRAVDRTFWPRAFGGCHTARDTPAAIQRAGFEIEELQRLWVPPVPVAVPVGTHALGRARKTGT